MSSGKKRNFILYYTFLFALLALGVYFWYIRAGKLIISQGDGWVQHYKFSVYYSQYIRKIFRTLLKEHRLVIPRWDMALGEGNDILQVFNYYGMGDPFECLSFLVPSNYIHIYYTAMVIARLYFSGLTFAWMYDVIRGTFSLDEADPSGFHPIGTLLFGRNKAANQTDKAEITRQGTSLSSEITRQQTFPSGETRFIALLAASLGYAFCFWNIYVSASHPFFLNPPLFMPLILGGIEKILRRESPAPFVLAVFSCSMTNLYFFYIIVLLTVLYVAVRLGDAALENFKKTALEVLRIFLYALLAVLLGAFVLLPVLVAFVSDGRGSIDYYMPALYPIKQYGSLLKLFVLPGVDDYWVCGGFGILGLGSVVLLFLKKGRERLKILFLLCLLIVAVPLLGRLLNAMSYVSNRWIWFAPLVVNCIIAEMIPEAASLFKKRTSRRGLLTACLALTCANILYASYKNNAPSQDNYVSSCIDAATVNANRENCDAVLLRNYKENIGDAAYSRYETRDVDYNNGVLYGQSTIQYYWSLTNPYVINFNREILTGKSTLFVIDGSDERMIPTALAGVKYYIVHKGSGAPRSYFRLAASDERFDIYEDPYFTGISYLYDTCASRSDFDSLNESEKEEALLSCAVLENQDAVSLKTIRRNDLETVKKRSISIGHADGQTVESDGTATVEVPLTGSEKGEKLLVIRGLYFHGGDATYANLCFVTDAGPYNDVGYCTEVNQAYAGVHDFAVNLYCTGGTVGSVTVQLTQPGTYEFDSIDVYSHSLEQDLSRIGGLQASGMENVVIGTDTITGTVTVQEQTWLTQRAETAAGGGSGDAISGTEDGSAESGEEAAVGKSMLLCLAVPYSKGWKATVDGEETKVYQTNVKYMSVEVPAGTHEITWTYERPLEKAGYAVTVLTLIGLFAYLIFRKKNKKEEPEAKTEEVPEAAEAEAETEENADKTETPGEGAVKENKNTDRKATEKDPREVFKDDPREDRNKESENEPAEKSKDKPVEESEYKRVGELNEKRVNDIVKRLRYKDEKKNPENNDL